MLYQLSYASTLEGVPQEFKDVCGKGLLIGMTQGSCTEPTKQE